LVAPSPKARISGQNCLILRVLSPMATSILHIMITKQQTTIATVPSGTRQEKNKKPSHQVLNAILKKITLKHQQKNIKEQKYFKESFPMEIRINQGFHYSWVIIFFLFFITAISIIVFIILREGQKVSNNLTGANDGFKKASAKLDIAAKELKELEKQTPIIKEINKTIQKKIQQNIGKLKNMQLEAEIEKLLIENKIWRKEIQMIDKQNQNKQRKLNLERSPKTWKPSEQMGDSRFFRRSRRRK
jgi:predicted PurR-regulated permease PerM